MASAIILDCDPGHDDAVAMLLAHGNPDIELLAVTTIGGNQTLDKVTRNALCVATILGIRDVPIAAGCSRPLIRPVRTAGEVHGDSGLDGPTLPEPTVSLDPRHGVDLIIDTVLEHPPGTITLVPTGPLTNIAMAVRKEPAIVERVQRVVLMGGGYHVGNWSATAEFNIAIDPEAAHIVFNETWPLVMVGLDLTHQALATPDVVARVAAAQTGPGVFLADLLEAFRRMYQDAQGFEYPPVHDPCAVAHVIDPSIVQTRPVPVDVELTGTLTVGMTVADFRSAPPPGCHTQVATTLDHSRFWDLVLDALDRIGPGGMS